MFLGPFLCKGTMSPWVHWIGNCPFWNILLKSLSMSGWSESIYLKISYINSSRPAALLFRSPVMARFNSVGVMSTSNSSYIGSVTSSLVFSKKFCTSALVLNILILDGVLTSWKKVMKSSIGILGLDCGLLCLVTTNMHVCSQHVVPILCEFGRSYSLACTGSCVYCRLF